MILFPLPPSRGSLSRASAEQTEPVAAKKDMNVMDTTLFGLTPTMLAFGLAILTGGALLVVAGLGASNPLLVRMGLRNMVRRPSQTLILLAGLVLSTVLITASFGLQDSFAASQTRYRLAQAGNMDEAVSGPFSQSEVSSGLTRLRQMPEVQTATAIILQRLAAQVTDVGSELTTPGIDLFAVPPAFDQVYGPLTTSSGQPVHFADLRAGEVFLSPSLAQIADLHLGQTIQVQMGSLVISARVRAILAHDIMPLAAELGTDGSFPAVFLSLVAVQQASQSKSAGRVQLVPNVICVKNIGPGGPADAGPGNTRSQTVVSFLKQFFQAHTDPNGTVPTDLSLRIVHPLEPDAVTGQGVFNAVTGKSEVILSPAARQFDFLRPAFTALLVGAGILFLGLLILLLAAERRAELGLSRAIGLSRWHLVLALLIEGTGYGVLAAFLGIPLGIGVTALAVAILSHLSGLSGGALGFAPIQPGHVPLSASLSWQSALDTWCIGLLTTVLIVLATALWISRMNVVAAIRNLDEPTSERASFLKHARALWTSPRDAAGQPVPETRTRRVERQIEALSGLVSELFWRGPLLLAGGILLLSMGQGNVQSNQDGQDALPLLGLTLLIAGSALLLNWLLPRLHVPHRLALRLASSTIGLGWLIVGIQAKEGFLFVSMLLPLAGGVMVVMTNADLLVALLSFLLRHLHRAAPVSRTSLVYPLTFRFRTSVTVALVGLITFLILLMVTTNLSLLQLTQAQSATGDFSLEMILNNRNYQALASQLRDVPTTLSHDMTAVAFLQNSYGIISSRTRPMLLHLPGQSSYSFHSSWGGPIIADNTFLARNTIPMLARAQNYATDRQVWDAVRTHTDDAVLRYDSSIPGLPTGNGFTPFTASLPESDEANAPYQQVTIIGIVPATTYWDAMFVSAQTAAHIWGAQSTPEIIHTYFQLQPGVGVTQASRDLNIALHLGERGIQVTALDSADTSTYTANLTLFLGGYLALGLLFGALSTGVIASRSVIERRQQIGMLRALGFSRALVRWSFLLEASFVITLSLAIGTVLAGWLAYQAIRQGSQDFPFPLLPIVLILLGTYLMAFVCTTLPARRASRLSPAEALRYE